MEPLPSWARMGTPCRAVCQALSDFCIQPIDQRPSIGSMMDVRRRFTTHAYKQASASVWAVNMSELHSWRIVHHRFTSALAKPKLKVLQCCWLDWRFVAPNQMILLLDKLLKHKACPSRPFKVKTLLSELTSNIQACFKCSSKGQISSLWIFFFTCTS